MPNKYVARPASERKLYLTHFQNLDRPDLELGLQWNWEDLETGETSQVFDSEQAALEAMRDERLEWSYLNDDGYVVSPLTEVDDFEDEQDEDEVDVTEVGELMAELHWDSGGPGAGAGVVRMYGHNGKFYVSHDAGVDEYDTAEEALLRNGFLKDHGADTSLWIHPSLKATGLHKPGSNT